MTTTRVLVALDVRPVQATDLDDLLASVAARLDEEAGYLDSGDPVEPVQVIVTSVGEGDDDLTADALSGIYAVGATFWTPERPEANDTERQYLTIRYEVTGWTPEQVAALEGAAWAQGEATDDYPDVTDTQRI